MIRNKREERYDERPYVVIRQEGQPVSIMPLEEASPLKQWTHARVTLCDNEAEARQEAGML